MNSPETPDPIDQLLREQDAYVPDDGFTRRVLAGLPRRQPWLPRIVLLSAILAGTAMAIFLIPWKTLPPLDYTQIFAENSKVLSAWIPIVAAGIALSSAVVTLFRRES